MKTLASRFTRLKTGVGGNREQTGYEETFGMPWEELHRVTVPGKWNRRILAELDFAIRLSAALGGRHDGILSAALDYLLEQQERQGVLTNEACRAGEEMLLPMEKDAKEYKLILAAHAHIDMNWMWGWEETVAATIATFRTMLDLMEEYPGFHYSQSQASVYKIIDDYAPELKPEIQKRIAEGRWEVTASAWVETDKNMPSTESLLNHIFYTRKYLQEKWGLDPASLDLDFSPDTFGHSAHVPEINSFGGVKYYYHCRGMDGDNVLYRWRAPSGREVLVYREPYWYNSGVTPRPGIGLVDVARRSGGLKTGLAVYGVGDHGGGPTRRDLERALEMMEWPVFPALRFGTFHEYFREAEAVADQVPLVEREVNFIFPGCYTTQSRIKMGNRRVEAALRDAQEWAAFASELDAPYGGEQFESAWQSLLFTHFHDILTGSCVQETREHAMGELAHAKAVADSRASLAMQRIAASIDTSGIQREEPWPEAQSEGAGAGYGLTAMQGVPAPERGRGLTRIYHLFNASSRDREQCCEITVWDWTGDLRLLRMEDGNGKELPFQLLDKELQHYWDHKFFRVLVQAPVPANGFATVALRQGEATEYPFYFQPGKRTHSPQENIVLENNYLRAEFDYRNGGLLSLVDKEAGRETLRAGETGGLRYAATERSTSNAWQIGRYMSLEGGFETYKLTRLEGELRRGFRMEQTVKSSQVEAEITLEENARHLAIRYKVDWHEVSRKEDPVPLLIYYLPVEKTERYLYDVPAGCQYRPAMDLDVPALQYGAAVHGDRAVFLSADCKYGYRGTGDSLICTLINATYHPDPYPERGIHGINLAVGVGSACPASLQGEAFDFCHPLVSQSGGFHKGALPLSASFAGVQGSGAVVSGIFRRENGKLAVRLYETCGKPSEVTIALRSPWESASLVDLQGNPADIPLAREGKAVSFVLPANTVAMLEVD